MGAWSARWICRMFVAEASRSQPKGNETYGFFPFGIPFFPFPVPPEVPCLTPPVARPMILLLTQNQEATDGVIRKAVWQPARFCIPLLRPHRHPWVPERLVPPRAGGLLFPRCRRRSRRRQD